MDTGGLAVNHAEHDASKLVAASPEILDEIFERLASSRAADTVQEHDDLCTRLGWNFIPAERLSFVRMLRPSEGGCSFDFMHCIFISGVFNIHVGLLEAWGRTESAVAQAPLRYAGLSLAVASWTWPKCFGFRSPRKALDHKRIRAFLEAGSFRCSASEGLSLCPVTGVILRQISDAHADPTLEMHVSSSAAACGRQRCCSS